MIRVCINIPEEGDDVHRVKIDADDVGRLCVQVEEHEVMFVLCKCGCKKRFQPDRDSQSFLSPDHQKRFNNDRRRKN